MSEPNDFAEWSEGGNREERETMKGMKDGDEEEGGAHILIGWGVGTISCHFDSIYGVCMQQRE